jgi:tubby-related protein 1
MKPVPPLIGQIQTSIERHKSGMNRLWPKFTLSLSKTSKFLLHAQKRSGNKTSNYGISIEKGMVKKGAETYLGKLRSNFIGTDFTLFNAGESSKNAKGTDDLREQLGVVQYETNVLGSKGPRRMKVLLPMVYRDGNVRLWKAKEEKDSISEVFKSGQTEDLMFFFNKPPKWNE